MNRNLGFRAEFRRQDHFRRHAFPGSNIGAEFERQPNFGFSQHQPNLGAEFKLQNLSFRGGRNRDPLPRVPALKGASTRLYIYLSIYVSVHLSIPVCLSLSIYLSIYPSIYLCISLPKCMTKLTFLRPHPKPDTPSPKHS